MPTHEIQSATMAGRKIEEAAAGGTSFVSSSADKKEAGVKREGAIDAGSGLIGEEGRGEGEEEGSVPERKTMMVEGRI